MKKLLSILLVSVLLIGCSENRVLIDELTNKGTEESPLMYYENDLFNGIAYSGSYFLFEQNYKDGKKDGAFEIYDVLNDNFLFFQANYKDGKKDGLSRIWYENGQLGLKDTYEHDVKDGSGRMWYDNGELLCHQIYVKGELVDYKYWDQNGNEIEYSSASPQLQLASERLMRKK